MSEFLNFLIFAISQFAGGTGKLENNLVRFGLTAILWGSLFFIAWGRLRERDLPREKMLIWGFGLGAVSAILMAGFAALQILELIERQASFKYLVPFERALIMASVIVVAGAFLRYILDDARLARYYVLAGLVITALCLALALWQWPRYLAVLSEAQFSTTWSAWLFVVPLSILIVVAIFLLRQSAGWLPKVVTVALVFFLVAEVLDMINFATAKSNNSILCPIGNSLRILAIPLLAYVYLREQSIERRQAEKNLDAYRLHLEELVEQRTAELTSVNSQLQQQMAERKLAEESLARLNERHELILETAGEGICGIDRQGRFSFINHAAAEMLGYRVAELVGQQSHPILHRHRADGSIYPEEACPMYAGYMHGIARQGDEEFFWRKDNSGFPVRYLSSPMYKDDILIGTVVVFRNITDRKRAEAEIARKNADLAAQNTIAAVLSQSLDLQAILETALDTVLSVVEMDFSLVFLQDADTGELTERIYRGIDLSTPTIETEQAHACCVDISGQAIRRMQAVVQPITADPGTWPGSHRPHPDLKLLVSVPLISQSQSIGALTLGSLKTGQLPASTVDLITTIGQQVAMAIENARLYQQTQRAARELALLHEMSAGLTSTFDTLKIYNQIAEQSARLLDCQLACILNWDKNRQEINCVTAYALDAADADLFRQHAGQVSPAGELLASQQTVAIDDARADPRLPSLWRENLAIRAALCVPIWSADQLLGALFLFDRRLPRRWRTEEIELVESFVNRAVVALMNASLHQQLEGAAALEERQRIAADMHDGLAQTISLLGLQVDEVGEFVRLGLDQQAEEELAYMRVVVERAALDVRKSISNLQGASQTHRSLQELLSEMPAQLPVGDGPQIQLSLPAGEPIFLPQDQSRQLVLIVQEALLNAHRHSQAQTIRLAMHTVDSQLRITVADDGVGFDPRLPAADRPGHFGLGILRARAARLAADLQIDSAQGSGTTVTLILPLSAASNPSQPNLTQLGAARSHGIASEIEA